MIVSGKAKVESNVQIPVPKRVKNIKHLITIHRRLLEMYRNEYIKYGHIDDGYRDYIQIAINSVELKLDKLKSKLAKSTYEPKYSTTKFGDILNNFLT